MTQQTAQGVSLESAKEDLQRIYEKYKGSPGNTIAILQDLQEAVGYISEEAVYWLADRLAIPRSRFYGVATFYSQFYLTPRGKNVITVCCGTACHVKGSEKILTRLKRDLNLAEDEDTTEDLNYTVEKVNCVGACSIAPVVIINKKVFGKADSNKIIKQTRALAGEEAKEGADN